MDRREFPALHYIYARALRSIEIARIQSRGARRRRRGAPALADDRAGDAQGLDRAQEVDGQQVEGTFRAHQVPIPDVGRPEHLALLEAWMRSYQPDELFDANGALRADLRRWRRTATRRMGANPHANGGLLLRDLRLPDFRDYAVDVPAPGAVEAEATRVQGAFIRDVMKRNAAATSASSAPTRPRRTAGTRSSR